MTAHSILICMFYISLSCENKSNVEYKEYLSSRDPVPDIALSETIKTNKAELSAISILIDKSEFTLQILAGDVVLKTYPVVFGENTIDDKLREGDKRTPEGSFKIRDLYPHKKWSKFLWINYPTEESYIKHNAAKAAGEIEENASIGGEIGIHGVPDNNFKLIDDMNNWTLGCISLKNSHIDEIYEFVSIGTEIVIRK